MTDGTAVAHIGRIAASGWGTAGRRYLNAPTMGIPTRGVRRAMRAALEEWSNGQADPLRYGRAVESSRSSFAAMVGVPESWVGVGATVSELVGPIAASIPDGSEIVVPVGDFTSILYPFMSQASRGINVRHVPIEHLAESIGRDTALVSYSHVQSSTGVVADMASIAAAARDVQALTLCDLTQSAGIHPVDATLADFTVCHSYKWLCAPRGAAFLTIRPELQESVAPLNAGWCAGEDVWASTYGPDMNLASDARRFDTSPAWLSWVGAAEALASFEEVEPAAAWRYVTALADRALSGLDLEPRGQAIVSLADPSGRIAESLAAHGVRFSCRAGGVRLGFHIWNDESDVDLVLTAARGS